MKTCSSLMLSLRMLLWVSKNQLEILRYPTFSIGIVQSDGTIYLSLLEKATKCAQAQGKRKIKVNNHFKWMESMYAGV